MTPSDQALALALAAFALLGSFPSLLVMLTDDKRLHETVELALVRLS